MRAPAPDTTLVEAPDWLPAPVRSYVAQIEKLLGPALPGEDVSGLFAEHFAILYRLASDARMKYVWRELRPRAKSDKALVEFFNCAWQCARIPDFVETPQDRAALAAPWLEAAKLCRWTKKHAIAARMDPNLAAALDLVARHFDEVARKEGRLDSPRIVKHHGKDDATRAYVRVLGHLTRELFGSTLFRTVATTASVALERRIEWQQVRRWTSVNLVSRK